MYYRDWALYAGGFALGVGLMLFAFAALANPALVFDSAYEAQQKRIEARDNKRAAREYRKAQEALDELEEKAKQMDKRRRIETRRIERQIKKELRRMPPRAGYVLGRKAHPEAPTRCTGPRYYLERTLPDGSKQQFVKACKATCRFDKKNSSAKGELDCVPQ